MSRTLVQPREHGRARQGLRVRQFTRSSSAVERRRQIKFVEEIQRSENDYKQLGEKYAKFFKK
jgi:hypothetical protein